MKAPVWRGRGLWLLIGVGGVVVETVHMGVKTFTFNHPYPLLHAVALPLALLAVLAGHRFPLGAFLAGLPSLWADCLVAPMVTLYTLALHRFDRRILCVCAVLFAAAAQVNVHLHSRVAVLDLVGRFCLFMVLSCPPLSMGTLTRTRRELAQKVGELEEAREREADLLTAQVLASERTRLARELHDFVAHHVALISVQAAALQGTATDGAARETAHTVHKLAGHTMSGLRDLLGVLRSTSPHGGRTPQPSLADLPQLISDSGLAATFHPGIALAGEGAVSWPDAVQHAVFRTVQEGLTNAAKHASGARVAIRLYAVDGRLHVTIRTAPSPAQARSLGLPASGYGLKGLRERAGLAGGTLTARRDDDGSHVLTASFPAPDVTRADTEEVTARRGPA